MAKNKKLKPCKSCGHEISAKGKVKCPECGAVNKPPIYKRGWFIVLAVIIVLGMIGSLGDNGDNELAEVVSDGIVSNTEPASQENKTVDGTVEEVAEETVDETEAEEEPVRTEFSVGEHIMIGDVVMTVNGIRDSMGSEYFAPEEGNVYKIVNLTINNIGDDFYYLSSLLGFSLQDTELYSYGVAIFADTKGKMDGLIAPGNNMVGEVAFEIPKDSTASNVFFDYSFWGSGQINIDLLSEPIDDGEYDNPIEPYQMKSIGDEINTGDITMVVNSVRYDQGSGYFGPEEGNIFAIIDVTVKNDGTEAIASSTLLSYNIVDSDGYYHGIEFMAETKGSIDGEIPAGQAKRGEVAFQVPTDTDSLYLVADLSLFDSGGELVEIK